MNYLALVNDVIDETKITLDPLTSVNFASPPRTGMYNRIKKWVNESYAEIIDERPEWYFVQERAVLQIAPRLRLANIDTPTYVPTAGDILTGVISGAQFAILSVVADTEGDDLSSGSEATIQIDLKAGTTINYNQLLVGESLNAMRGITPFLAAARVEGRGFYDFTQYLPTLDALNENSIRLQPNTTTGTVDPGPNDLQPLFPIAYNKVCTSPYLNITDDFGASLGRPRALIQTSRGTYDFFPRPDDFYTISFDYTQKPNVLALYNDEPFLLSSKFHKLIVWRACIKMADFDRNTQAYATAKKNADLYYNRLLRDRLPKSMFDLTRFDRGYENRY